MGRRPKTTGPTARDAGAFTTLPVALAFHPVASIVVFQLVEKLKGVGTEAPKHMSRLGRVLLRAGQGGQDVRNFERMQLMLGAQPGHSLVEQAIAFGWRIAARSAVVQGGVSLTPLLIPGEELLGIP